VPVHIRVTEPSSSVPWPPALRGCWTRRPSTSALRRSMRRSLRSCLWCVLIPNAHSCHCLVNGAVLWTRRVLLGRKRGKGVVLGEAHAQRGSRDTAAFFCSGQSYSARYILDSHTRRSRHPLALRGVWRSCVAATRARPLHPSLHCPSTAHRPVPRVSSLRLLVHLVIVLLLLVVSSRRLATLRRRRSPLSMRVCVRISIAALLLILRRRISPATSLLLVVIAVVPLLILSLVISVVILVVVLIVILIIVLFVIARGRSALRHGRLVTVLLLSWLIAGVILLLVCHGASKSSDVVGECGEPVRSLTGTPRAF
jgi:hypothetical protein